MSSRHAISRPSRTLAGVAMAVVSAACATRPPEAAPRPVPSPRRTPEVPVAASVVRAPLPPANPMLPPVPQVNGPLSVRVVYPDRSALITSRDSNFIIGSVGNGGAGLRINGDLVPVWPNGAFLGWVPNPPADSQWYDLVAYSATDTVKLRYPVRTLAGVGPRPVEPPAVTTFARPLPATLRDDSLDRTVSDTDDVIIGRPTPGGDYKWFLFPGTPVRLLEYRNDMARVSLDRGQDVWVQRRDVKSAGQTDDSASLTAGPARMSSSDESVDVQFAVSAPPAYAVNESEREITLTLYNVSADSPFEPAPDSLIESATQTRENPRTIYRFTLTRAVYGYRVLFENGQFKLSIRRPPVVNAVEPLRGMTIVVDPGHPPIGATGPTGLYEPVPTLAVGLRVRDLLEARGARVVMTRTNAAPVALGERPIIARRADANAFVSIHLNADGDGQNPFRDNGTGTYYFQPQSKALARMIQDALVPRMGLRDRGIFYQNLAVARPTWYPAVLAEGLFIILPDQEAAIQTPQYQEAYARGIVDGLEKYFATLVR
ncbi:MAG: N-acetylmuramoyl-L-alanine amidase [Gemmatimonadota bacterium]|nr:N-acetylmuramoyl-L-alanine amidase [Gemmatimonadota bacterium]